MPMIGSNKGRGFNQGTTSGRPFFASDPRPEDISLDDIAAHLARICRYGGALRADVEHYSVAQHSVLVSFAVPAEHALEALLHDAAEAYIGDMIAPLKHDPCMQGYREVEDRVDRVIRQKWGLPATMTPAVKRADLEAAVTEKRDLLTPSDDVDWGPNLPAPWPRAIVPLRPKHARTQFLARYMQITGEIA